MTRPLYQISVARQTAMKSTPVLTLLLILCAVSLPGKMAMSAEPDKSAAVADANLTPEEKAEKEARKACKVDLCQAFHTKVTGGNDIACHVIKSWRKEQLIKLVGKLKVTWPYDGVRCTTDLSVKRADLVRAMTEKTVEIQFQNHAVTCIIASDKSGATHFKFELAPKVKFENGKATEAHAHWGKIEAPTLIKSALWSATAADNTVNLLSSTIVDEVNEFVSKKCDEVKDKWASKP
jgi:hypothetical protein